MTAISLSARLSRETALAAWKTLVNVIVRVLFFGLVIARPLQLYLILITKVGIRNYPWHWMDLVVPFVAMVILYPVVLFFLYLRARIDVREGVLSIRTMVRERRIFLTELTDKLYVTNERLSRTRRLFAAPDWSLVVSRRMPSGETAIEVYTLGPFWKGEELQTAIEKINLIR